MSIDQLVNRVKGHAGGVAMQMGQNRWATVANVRQVEEGYDLKVIIQPDEIASAWLPTLTTFGGAGWGLVARPSVGMQVLIVPDSGDGHHYIVAGMAYSTQNPAPQPTADFNQTNGTPVEDGEIAVVSKTGAVCRFCADGSVYIKAPTVKIDGDLIVQGNITANQGYIQALRGFIKAVASDVYDRHGWLDRLRSVYNGHVHGNSGPPRPTDPE